MDVSPSEADVVLPKIRQNSLEVQARDQSTRDRGGYFLTEDRFNELQVRLSMDVRRHLHGVEDLCGVWVGTENPYADLIRSLEHINFPTEFPRVVTDQFEQQSRFLIVVDLRDGVDRIAHGARISSPRFSNIIDISDHRSTGCPSVDEWIRDGRITRDEFVAFCDERDYDIAGVYCTETNFVANGWRSTLTERVHRLRDRVGRTTAEIGYYHICDSLLPADSTRDRICMFALANRLTTFSFAQMGISVEEVPLSPDAAPHDIFTLIAIKYDSSSLEYISGFRTPNPPPRMYMNMHPFNQT